MVRDRLWEKVGKSLKDGSAVLIATSDNEQGYTITMLGERGRTVRDFEGLQLITVA